LPLIPLLTIALRPLLITLGSWQGRAWVNRVWGMDIRPLLSLLGWRGMLLWVPALVVSGTLLGKSDRA
jgi:hypothetical protein